MVIIIGVAVVVPVIQNMASDPNISQALGKDAGTILSILPVIIVIALILMIVGMFTGGPVHHETEEPVVRTRTTNRRRTTANRTTRTVASSFADDTPANEPVIEEKPVNPLEPEVPDEYKKPGSTYREIRADMLLDEKKKKEKKDAKKTK